MSPEITEVITGTLIPGIATVIGLLITWGLTEVTRWVRAKSKNEAVWSALGIIQMTVEGTVKSLQQMIVDGMKADLKDGTWTDDERVMLKSRAVAEVLGRVPDSTQKIARVGIGSITKMVEAEIEKVVYDMNAEKAETTCEE